MNTSYSFFFFNIQYWYVKLWFSIQTRLLNVSVYSNILECNHQELEPDDEVEYRTESIHAVFNKMRPYFSYNNLNIKPHQIMMIREISPSLWNRGEILPTTINLERQKRRCLSVVFERKHSWLINIKVWTSIQSRGGFFPYEEMRQQLSPMLGRPSTAHKAKKISGNSSSQCRSFFFLVFQTTFLGRTSNLY